MSCPLDECEIEQVFNDGIKQPVGILGEQGNVQPCFNEESMLMDDSHVPSYEFDESLQQTY